MIINVVSKVYLGKQFLSLSFHPFEKQGNWSWRLGDGVPQYRSLDFLHSMAIFKANRILWTKIVTAAFHAEYGQHLIGKERLEKRIALNFFGWENPIRCPDSVLLSLCPKHEGGEDTKTCLQCGAPYNEDEEEENAADICICGETEDACVCAPCHVCGEKTDCVCVICDDDDCLLCICEDKDHIELSHRPCDCDKPCSPEERQTRHEIRSCPGHELPCEDCKKLPCVCEDSKSEDYDYSFGH